ncbi:MAG: glycosyltransferase family 2 protein [Candidatus Paceibacterota bacterium]|jgi:glycosyltransferase involved in cell wall biosynthesis
MYHNKKISVYLPCRNEAAHLQNIISKIPKFVDEVIIISNRSTDNTMEMAQKLGVRAIQDDREKGGIGYGFAHMTGLENSTGDIVATADGDGTYPLEKLAEAIDFMLDQKKDFISCNRYPLQPGTKIPFKLQLGVNLLNWEVRLLYGLKINDILSGMWLVRQDTIKHLGLTEGDWNLSPQIKLNAASTKDINFSEFSIGQSLRLGQTKQNYWKTGFDHLRWIFKNRFTTSR